MALVAEGQFDAILTFRDSWEWDIAAGALIATEAGATVTDKHGAALRFNSPEAQTKGVVSSGCKLHPQILSRLAYNS
jgi:myo-inositol-1(or 4)-monophosphatase